MDWHQELTVISGALYASDRWIGQFSSHAAALSGVRLMRKIERLVATECETLTNDDLDLLEAIDHDEA